MSETLDKKHWYDGWFYAEFVVPWEKEIGEIISNFIENESTVIDIGCGTGAIVFRLAEKCKRVIGIELSLKMIQYAGSVRHSQSFKRLILEGLYCSYCLHLIMC